MARTVKEEEHRAKRNAILDEARRLIEAKGYERMAIQDILDELGISKGAFYHYFDSKPDLLVALVERRGDELERLVLPIFRDEELSALDKLLGYFATHDRFKRESKEFVLELTRVWFADENAIVRHKLLALVRKRLAPRLSEIIGQGVEEGVFTTPYPDHAARMVVSLLDDLGHATAEILLSSDERGALDASEMVEVVEATADAVERVLGAEPGCLRETWREALSHW